MYDNNIHIVTPSFHPYHKSQFEPIFDQSTIKNPSDEKMNENNKKEDCCIICCEIFDSIMSCCAWCYICSIITK